MAENAIIGGEESAGDGRLTVADLYKPRREFSKSSPVSPVSSETPQACLRPAPVPFDEDSDCTTGGTCDPNCRRCR
jgi:hypothetical protein